MCSADFLFSLLGRKVITLKLLTHITMFAFTIALSVFWVFFHTDSTPLMASSICSSDMISLLIVALMSLVA